MLCTVQAVVYPKKMLDTKFVSRTSIVSDTWRVSTPLVFPQLADNVDDPNLYQNALQAHRAAPLAALAGNDQQLQVRCWQVVGAVCGKCCGVVRLGYAAAARLAVLARWLPMLSGLRRDRLHTLLTTCTVCRPCIPILRRVVLSAMADYAVRPPQGGTCRMLCLR